MLTRSRSGSRRRRRTYGSQGSPRLPSIPEHPAVQPVRRSLSGNHLLYPIGGSGMVMEEPISPERLAGVADSSPGMEYQVEETYRQTATMTVT